MTDPARAWMALARERLGPERAFEEVLAERRRLAAEWDDARGPFPAWVPTPEEAAATNAARLAREQGLEGPAALHAWSVREPEPFWAAMLSRLQVAFARPPERVLDASRGPRRPVWLPGARLNAAASCFQGSLEREALRFLRADGTRGAWSLGELRALSARVASGLAARGIGPGDGVGVVMPMTPEAVAIYLGTVALGAVVVSIPDSFSAPELAARLRLGRARVVFSQDAVPRGPHERPIPLHERVIAAAGPPAVVLGAAGAAPSGRLRAEDVRWEPFLGASAAWDPLPCDPAARTNLLFSSGTTGEPKAIPWSHTTPLKAAADGHLLQDLGPGDVAAWPTNLGWMMGPWLIYAGLLNGAALSLAEVPPGSRAYCEHVARSGVTMQGVVPTLVKTWRAADATRGLDWTGVRRFSSTGECSNPDDMLWLMWRAGWRPVLEYCGGTEVGGGYLGATLCQPQAPSCFSTPAFGIDLRVRDGEAFLVPPALGLSLELVGRDHDEVYFAGCPDGLRRHGDEVEPLPGGSYRVRGRADDTMNLGGIKVGSAEIERACNGAPGVHQSAAVAIPEPGGGPSQLVVFVEPAPGAALDAAALREELQARIKAELNPLFKLALVQVVARLPRTPSNKVLRRQLRDELLAQVRA